MTLLNKFIEIESNPELYRYTFLYNNALMYPFIRYSLLQNAIGEELCVPNPYDHLKIGKIQNLKYKLKSFFYRAQKAGQSDIVFFGSDISNIQQGEAYFNRLTEVFANEYRMKTILIEGSDKMNYKRPRTYPKVYARDYINIITGRKVNKKMLSSDEINQIDLFLQFLKQSFSHKFENIQKWDAFRNSLIYSAKALPFLFESYTKLLKKMGPKIIFIEDACYGGEQISLIMAARKLGIIIGEYQHGLISLTHPAYNYSAHIPDAYKQYMPDFYMNYGSYWTKNSRLPIRVIGVGNPFLSETTSHYNNSAKKEQFLYVSSALTPERYCQEVIQLNKRLKDIGCSVVFRIHPSEKGRLHTVYRSIVEEGIEIDKNPLYQTLSETKYLVGDVSTVLFEATLFDCIVFVMDMPYNVAHIDTVQFNKVYSVDDVVKKIISKDYRKSSSTDFWSSDWRIRYRELINCTLATNRLPIN